MKNKFTFAATMTFLLVSLSIPLHVYGAPVTQDNHPSISVKLDNTGWFYKTINGKSYKRLYNYTTNKWIGDWIPA